MGQCEQTPGQSVLDHGESVNSYLFDLVGHLRTGQPLKFEWKLPDWIYEHKNMFLESLPDDETLSLYTRYHDIGKPFCLEIDENGRRHFPNHAEVSYKVFTQFFENNVAAELIRSDMDIHSNAQMFGGMSSTSFKIKWKAITQRGKQITKIKSQEHDNSRIY